MVTVLFFSVQIVIKRQLTVSRKEKQRGNQLYKGYTGFME